MGFGGSPSVAAPPPPPPPPPSPAQAADSTTQQAGAVERARLAAASGAGFEGTIASSPEGAPLQAGQTQAKQLLGY